MIEQKWVCDVGMYVPPGAIGSLYKLKWMGGVQMVIQAFVLFVSRLNSRGRKWTSSCRIALCATYYIILNAVFCALCLDVF